MGCNWKKKIRTLGKDFCLNEEKVECIIQETENSNKEMPSFYNCKSDYMYDQCHAKIRDAIMQRLA